MKLPPVGRHTLAEINKFPRLGLGGGGEGRGGWRGVCFQLGIFGLGMRLGLAGEGGEVFVVSELLRARMCGRDVMNTGFLSQLSPSGGGGGAGGLLFLIICL